MKRLLIACALLGLAACTPSQASAHGGCGVYGYSGYFRSYPTFYRGYSTIRYSPYYVRSYSYPTRVYYRSHPRSFYGGYRSYGFGHFHY